MKGGGHLSRLLFARCSAGTGCNRLPNIAASMWFSLSEDKAAKTRLGLPVRDVPAQPLPSPQAWQELRPWPPPERTVPITVATESGGRSRCCMGTAAGI